MPKVRKEGLVVAYDRVDRKKLFEYEITSDLEILDRPPCHRALEQRTNIKDKSRYSCYCIFDVKDNQCKAFDSISSHEAILFFRF